MARAIHYLFCMSDETELPISPEEYPEEGSPFPTLEEMAELLPQYEFHNILGVGGMGAVYLARQAALDRWVALKLLPVSAAQNEEDAQRFITEARSMAKLTHAHIAAVYDFGQTTQGHLFLVMEYVSGQDLHRLIHSDEVTPERIRSLVPQLCDALTYAHSHNVIHRDIKPANILITEDWQAKIVDFGLARDKDTDAAGEAEYGTPDYVAPERLQADATVDHRADIYALGVVIHEMFTKLTPRAAGAAAGQGVPAEYASIVSRCMMVDPARRFQKCSEIKAFLNAAAIAAATPAAPVHRAPPPQLQARIRPQGSAPVPQKQGSLGWLWAAACIVLLAAGGWFIQQQRNSDTAAKSKTDGKVEKSADTATPNNADAAKMANGAATPTILSNAPAGPFKPEAGDFSVLRHLKGHNELVYSCAILPDQRRAVSGGHDDTLILWDVATGALLKRFPSPVGDIHGIEVAADGKRILLYSYQSDQVAIFDIEQGQAVASIKAPTNRLFNATWAADQKSAYLLCNDTNGGVYYWDPSKGAVLQQFSEWPRAANQLIHLPATKPDDKPQLLVIGSTMKPNPNFGSNSTQRIIIDKPWAALFSAPEHRLIRELPDYKNIRSRFLLSPDGSTLVSNSGTLNLHDVPALNTRFIINPPAGTNSASYAWAEAGRLLVCGYSNGKLIIHEADTGIEMTSLDIGMRANTIRISQDEGWMMVSAFPLDVNKPESNAFDVLVIRLPELNRLGSNKSFLSLATRQLANLEKFDPELAALRAQSAPPNSLSSDEQLRELTTKYGAALNRTAVSASPKDQLAMRAEASAIAAGQPVPDPSTDAATSGDHKRLRGIYRQQTAQLEQRLQESAAALRQSLGSGVRGLADKRQQAGDRLGAARCDALLASLGTSKPVTPVSAPAPAPTAAPQAMPPPAPMPLATAAPKAPFGNNVKIEVMLGRPTKTEGGDFDDEMQVINPRLKLTNASPTQAYEGYVLNFILFGESTIDMKVIKVLQRESFPVSLPVRQSFENKLPKVTTQFDTTGAKFGYKYQGWVVQVTGPSGEIVLTKSTSSSFEKLPELVKQMKADQCYDKKLKAVPEPVLRF
jgi:serine/threonine protein kinase/WD40 repeat protein